MTVDPRKHNRHKDAHTAEDKSVKTHSKSMCQRSARSRRGALDQALGSNSRRKYAMQCGDQLPYSGCDVILLWVAQAAGYRLVLKAAAM
jgi:hypothetical protein